MIAMERMGGPTRRWFRAVVGLFAVCAATAVAPVSAASAGDLRVDRSSPEFVASMQRQIIEARIANIPLRDFARQHGLMVISEPSTSLSVTPLSTGGDYNVPTPTLLYDAPSQTYYAYANYNWVNAAYWTDCPGWTTGNCGGIDGFGIRSSVELLNLGGTAYFCYGPWDGPSPYPAKPACITGWAVDNSEYGVSFGFQDRRHGTNISGGGGSQYNIRTFGGHLGHITFAFRKLFTGCYQFFSRYEHTWSSTTINGFGVEYWGFSVSWSSDSNHQQRTSSAAYLGCS
jgi:hypothetical protein